MFITMGQGIAGPILPLLVESKGLPAVMVGFAVSAFALARVFANIPAGILTRKRGARFVLALGALLSAVGNLCIAVIPGYIPLVLFRFVAGLGSAFFITAAIIFVAGISSHGNRGRLMTIYQGAFILGFVFGPSIGGISASLFGLTSPFLIISLFSTLALAWTLAKIPPEIARITENVEPKNPATQSQAVNPTSSPVKGDSLFRNVSYLSVNLIVFGVFFTRGAALFNLWPLLAKRKFELDPGKIGLLLTVPSATNLAFQPFVGAMTDHFGRKAILVPTAFLFTLALVVSAVSPSIHIFAMAMVIYGVAQSMAGPSANSYVADIAPTHQQAIALATNRTFGDVGLVLGSPLLGIIADFSGIPWGLVVNSGIILIPGLIFAIFAKSTKVRLENAK